MDMDVSHRRGIFAAALLGAAAAVLVAILLSGGSGGSSSPLPVAEATVRTVRVSAKPDDAVSDSPHSLRAWRVGGSIPASPTMAMVRTDEDCAPDEQGISRCLNELRLADGRRLVLRHAHSMARVPCMSPGERIRVIPQ
jgi:hypothetical protein